MNAKDYVDVMKAVKNLESTTYLRFDEMWGKLRTNKKLTKEEVVAMDYYLWAMQDLGFIRGCLEKLSAEEDK